ncbi:cutinase family protein [Mycobacterium sp. 1274756.6]|uniref:cutinase family protein n=1 Tax=Mycobacterium sp. 1274756.6 TaxID=1834076 RepID=UPI0009ECDA4D|nr:cutinase family protein [Mycobacterium sp. 1274756.6]
MIGVLRILGAAVLAGAAVLVPAALPSASADPCPDAEVVFGRGSGEPAGLGGVGHAFVDALRAKLPDKSIADYPVNYPATHDYHASSEVGVNDTVAHVQSVIASCPDTKIVLGGYSQGALVMEMTSDRLAPEAADHIAAVTLFGPPTSSYAASLWGGPPPVLNESYRPKTAEYCVPDDIVCTEGGNMVAHALGYADSGLPAQGADFAASRL